MNLKNQFLTTACALVISGCGGGGGSSDPGDSSTIATNTGVFLDAPVSGLTYETETQSGITNDAGEFLYVAGESVSFSFDGLDLGTADAMEIVPVTTLPNGLSVAVILQSLDTDPEEGIIALGDVRLMDSSRQVLSDILSGDQDDSAFDSNLLNDIKQATTEAGGIQPYLDAPVSRAAAIEHVKQQFATEFSFSNDWLDNRMMVTTNTLLGGETQTKYAWRFDKDAQLRMVGFSDAGDEFNYDKLDRTITTEGALSITFGSGTTCVWEPVGETEYTVETIVSCDGDTPRARSFYVSQPLTPADLTGKTYTVTSENGDTPFSVSLNDGSIEIDGNEVGTYSSSAFEGIYANFNNNTADVWFLLKGDTNNGLMMNWGYKMPENTVETMSFVRLIDGNRWHGFNWSYPY